MNNRKYLRVMLFCAVSAVSGLSFAQKGMTMLTDEELSAQDGQALLNLSYLAPTDATNPTSNNAAGQNIGFYKLGIEGKVEINANIKKLQLGCGGVNGAGGCDIDIDNVSLSGLGNSATSNTSSAADRTARASSDAVLTNPFLNIAIKNPNSASTRQVVGIQLGSSAVDGLITFGTENSATPNGINSLSGYMQVAATTGTALVNGFGTSLVGGEAARTQLRQSDGYDPITGRACCVFFVPLGFTTTAYDLNLRDKATGSNILKGDLVLPTQTISGRRISSAPLTAIATVRDIDLSGTLSANAGGLIDLNNKTTTGTLKNLIVDVALSENLGMFHKANLNGTAAGLSLQGEDIRWPGSQAVAQRGWWLEFSNPLDIGRIDPVLPVDIPKATLNESLAQVSQYLDDNPIQCGPVIASSCLLGSAIPVGTVDLINATHANMPLNDLQLVKQDFTPNCYGGLKFC